MVRFIYNTSNYDPARESVVINICTLTAKIIELPQLVEVEFTKLPDNIYGETILDPRFKDRFRLNDSLSPKESIVPTIHELVHVSQMHTGQLKGLRDGTVVWGRTMYRIPKTVTHAEWQSFPWEQDVMSREQSLLMQVLGFKPNHH